VSSTAGHIHHPGVGLQNGEKDITGPLGVEIVDLESLDSLFVEAQSGVYPDTDGCIVDQNIQSSI